MHYKTIWIKGEFCLAARLMLRDGLIYMKHTVLHCCSVFQTANLILFQQFDIYLFFQNRTVKGK